MNGKRVTTRTIIEKKQRGEKITALTAYDFATAKLIDEAGVDIVLVGDTLGMVVLGYDSTLPVTMDMMIHHAKAVVRGVERALVVGDMPFMSYQVSAAQAVANAGRYMQEAGVHAVKLEGGRHMAETIKRIVGIGIPVMGHVGMTPQSVHQFGGFRVQGKSESDAKRIMDDAKILEEAGVFAMVLEVVPSQLAAEITAAVSVPTVGIGAGPDCDGQVQVTNDILGLYGEFHPRHAKKYANLSETMLNAFKLYLDEVRTGKFPGTEQSF